MVFFKIGLFTFGGGYAMIPLIEKEMIANKAWVKEEEIIDIFAVSQSIPGAIAINSSTFIGYKIAGIPGALAATAGVVIPSFIIITIIATFFSRFQNNPIVQAAFIGIRSAVVALILMAVIKIGKSSIKDRLTALITVLAVILVILINVHAIFVIIGGAAAGIIVYLWCPSRINGTLEREEKKYDIS
ncbi:chromate transporter [Natronincola ferrireducens]|nr:chromate transporter [Natronincola ferrireducens]